MNLKSFRKIFVKAYHQPPGTRFSYLNSELNRRLNDNLPIKLMYIIISFLCFIIGVLLLFLPGPGLIFIFISVCFLSIFSKKIAAMLDYVDKKAKSYR